MRVRATRRGFYGTVVRRVADVFDLHAATDFSPEWMVRVPSDTPTAHTSARGALRAFHDEQSPIGGARVTCWPADPDDDQAVICDPDPFA